MNFISVILSLHYLSDLLSESFCLLGGMPLETVVFHLLVSVRVLSLGVELMPLPKIKCCCCCCSCCYCCCCLRRYSFHCGWHVISYSKYIQFRSPLKYKICCEIPCEMFCTAQKIIARREPAIFLRTDANYEQYSLHYILPHHYEALVSF